MIVRNAVSRHKRNIQQFCGVGNSFIILGHDAPFDFSYAGRNKFFRNIDRYSLFMKNIGLHSYDAVKSRISISFWMVRYYQIDFFSGIYKLFGKQQFRSFHVYADHNGFYFRIFIAVKNS